MKASARQTKSTATPVSRVISGRVSLLQRKSACGGAAGPTGECEAYRKKKLQRATGHSSEIPPIVREVLRSTGQPLDSATHALMEPRFGHDFSQVRAHGGSLPTIQARLSISEPGDQYEWEADRVAEQVMRMPKPATVGKVGANKFGAYGRLPTFVTSQTSPFVQRQVEPDERAGERARILEKAINNIKQALKILEDQKLPPREKGRKLKELHLERLPTEENKLTPIEIPEDPPLKLQIQIIEKLNAWLEENTGKRKRTPILAKRTGGSTGSIQGAHIVYEALVSPGQPLDAATRAFFEQRFGHDFSRVRVHTNAKAAESAQAVNALAYTVGKDVVFGTGQFAPATSAGQRLLAHELAHVTQQSAALPAASHLHIGEPSDSFERAADHLAHQVIHGAAPAATSASIQTMSSAAVLQRQPVAGGDDPVLEVGTGSPLEASFAGSMTLDNFGFNKPELTAEHIAALKDHAKRINQLLKHYRDSFISITGHTDAVGGEQSNQELGQKRANAVLSELTTNGVPADILRAGSLGETALAVATKKAEPHNRRVEIFFRARRSKGALLGGELELGTKSPASLPGFLKELKPPTTKRIDLSLPIPSTFPGPFDPSLGLSPPEKKTSVSKLVDDKVDDAINPLIKRLPKWMQERIRSGAHSLIEKGASSLLDQALKASSLDETGKEAVRKTVEATMKIEFNLP